MRELVDLLIRSKVPHLIIGGHAVGMHGGQRDTVDLDCLIAAENRREMTEFLKSRGFEETAEKNSFSRFRHRSLVYPMLDLMEVDAGIWQRMWDASVEKTFAGLTVRVPTAGHCVAMKLHAISQNPPREWKDGEDIVRILRANPDVFSRPEFERLCERYALPEIAAKIWDRV